jgi:endoglucanase
MGSRRGKIEPLVLVGLIGPVLFGVLVVGSRTPATGTPPATAGPAAAVRVDSVGFSPNEVKRAYLMTNREVSGETFTVVDAHGAPAFSGTVGSRSRGRWSSSYPAVYPLRFTGLRTAGTYTIHVSGTRTATSQPFRIESARALNLGVVRNGVSFFHTQRDGTTQVAGPLHRRPSHLHDAHAAVYRSPHFAHPNRSDLIRGGLHRVSGRRTIDAAGGWFDAGDYLKFTHTAAYADIDLLASERALGRDAPAALRREARQGEKWLSKMWRQRTRTLYLQVGIGSGDRSGSYYGDHDLWRLPQADDRDGGSRDRFAAAHRPVFRAAAPGHPISPNLAGRVSAAFALAAQSDAAHHRPRARRELHAAHTVYRMAATRHPPHPLVTAAPVEYYPEDSWHDDMALGGAEIALADRALGRSARQDTAAAAHWASAYLRHDTSSETFNLYDTSALAEADLVTALRRKGAHRAVDVTTRALIDDLHRQISGAAHRSARDPFAAGGFYDEFDVDSHTFGLIATVEMYDAVTHGTAFRGFATAQRDWLFGANAWGASFMVGAGANFPHCMQHQVANLSGTTDGTAPLDVGAVVNGPNGADNFEDGLGGFQDGMVHCSAGSSTLPHFDARGSRYVDDVRSWQTDEPALDMTGAAIIAAATQLHLHPSARIAP